MTHLSHSGAVEVWSESTGKFLVNGQRLKHYHPFDTRAKFYLVLLSPLRIENYCAELPT